MDDDLAMRITRELARKKIWVRDRKTIHGSHWVTVDDPLGGFQPLTIEIQKGATDQIGPVPVKVSYESQLGDADVDIPNDVAQELMDLFRQGPDYE